MDRLKIIDQCLDSVKAVYKNWDVPDFHFARLALADFPYKKLVKALREYSALEEEIVHEEDVCFRYMMTRGEQAWMLMLSMAGQYAILAQLKGGMAAKNFLYREEGLSAYEVKIINILKSHKIILLTPDILETPVPLMLFNTKKNQTTLYQALFCDQEKLPWKA